MTIRQAILIFSALVFAGCASPSLQQSTKAAATQPSAEQFALRQRTRWKFDAATLVRSGPPTEYLRDYMNRAMTAIFEVEPDPGAKMLGDYTITVVHDPVSQTWNLMLGGSNWIYVAEPSGVWGYWVGDSTVQRLRPFVTVPDSPDALERAAERFEHEFDGASLYEVVLAASRKNIGLRKAAPAYFFSDAPYPGGTFTPLEIETVGYQDGILQIGLRNPWQKREGTFWIRTNDGVVTRSVCDGKEMSIGAGDGWALPK